MLSTEKVSGFSGGAYLNWTISGNVLITITKLGGPNAVLSGLFFDPTTSASVLANVVQYPAAPDNSTASSSQLAAERFGVLDFTSSDGQAVPTARGTTPTAVAASSTSLVPVNTGSTTRALIAQDWSNRRLRCASGLEGRHYNAVVRSGDLSSGSLRANKKYNSWII